MDPITTAALISAGSSILGGLFGGGSEGSETSTRAPAPWEDESQKAVYDMYFSGLLDKAVPLSDRFTQDDTQQRQFYKNYIDRLGKNTAGYIDTLKGISDMMGRSKVSGSVGGNQIDIVPKSTRQTVDDISALADKIMSATETQEGRELQYGTEMTPNRAYFNYLDYLKEPTFQLLANRYGIPSTTATGEYELPWSQRVGDAIQMLTPLYEKYKTPTTSGYSDISREREYY